MRCLQAIHIWGNLEFVSHRCALPVGHDGFHGAAEYRWPLELQYCGHADSCIAGEGLTHWCQACGLEASARDGNPQSMEETL